MLCVSFIRFLINLCDNVFSVVLFWKWSIAQLFIHFVLVGSLVGFGLWNIVLLQKRKKLDP
jgi:hypothetical protein